MHQMIQNQMKLPAKKTTVRGNVLHDDVVYHEDELSPEQWAELRKRGAEIDAGTAVMITTEELKDLLRKRRSELPAKP